MSINSDIPVRVTKITDVTGKIKRFRFERIDGQPLPIFSAGAHVVVTMHDDGHMRRNPYSLMSAPHDSSCYEISVLHVEDSRGGSAYMHQGVREGDHLTISQPVNLFPADARGRKHILVAGGIGITPFLAMMAQFRRSHTEFELHYAMRSRSHGAYWQKLMEQYGPERIKVYFDEENTRIPLAQILYNQPLSTHFYVCGPAGMIDFCLRTAREAGWPKENLHSERFLAPPPGQKFTVELVRSGKTIEIAEHQSILEAIEGAGVDAPYMCRGGACGQCETGVVRCDGSLEHNDIYLTDEEKAGGRKIMVCVSRFKGKTLVLDI
ncbi:MAG: ferredoxin--NADP(+) reductase [Rhizobium sp.]|nr:ferredoxin--NADP(+) reductase [Rhizobium sp.]